MTIELRHVPVISVSDEELLSIACDKYLSADEIVASVVSVTEVDSSHVAVSPATLTITNIVVGSTAKYFENLKRTVPANEMIHMLVSGQAAGNTYRLRVKFKTNSAPVRTKNVVAVFKVAS